MRAPGGYDTQLWQQISGELGWCALAIPEDCDGAGLGWVELCLLQEEQGRRLLASPFFATAALGAAIIRAAPQGAQRTALLQLIAARSAAHRCALAGEDGRPPPQGTSVTLAARDATLTPKRHQRLRDSRRGRRALAGARARCRHGGPERGRHSRADLRRHGDPARHARSHAPDGAGDIRRRGGLEPNSCSAPPAGRPGSSRRAWIWRASRWRPRPSAAPSRFSR